VNEWRWEGSGRGVHVLSWVLDERDGLILDGRVDVVVDVAGLGCLCQQVSSRQWWLGSIRHMRPLAADIVGPIRLSQPLDLKGVGKFEEVVEIRLLHLNFALVDEEQEISHNLLAGILEDNDRMLLREVLEKPVKVVAARGKNHSVGGHGLSI